jgi:hypothetical protein
MHGYKTPEDLSGDIRAGLATRRRALEDACHQRALTITPPADCPKALGKRIGDHNAAAVAFLERRAALDEAFAALPLAMTDRAADPADWPKRAAKLRVEHYVLCRQHIALLEAREPLLKDVAEELAKQVPGAEETLVKAREEALAGLKASGWVPLAARRPGQAGKHPDIEARQFEAEVNNMVPVAAARTRLSDLRRGVTETEALAGAVDADIAVVGQDLIAAWRLLVGAIL